LPDAGLEAFDHFPCPVLLTSSLTFGLFPLLGTMRALARHGVSTFFDILFDIFFDLFLDIAIGEIKIRTTKTYG
jgi:hypothetical protein